MRTPKEFVADIPALMEEWDFEKNTSLCIFPDKLGSQSNTYAYWVCKYGHKWKAKINNRYNGRGCPECKKRLQTSFPEQAVFFYVKQKYPDAINSYTNCFNNGMELDVFIPSLNVGIEYDGKAWHDDDKLKNEKLKYDICRHHSIKLIRVKENINHYRNRNTTNVADDTILMRQSFSGSMKHYALLDVAIRTLLAKLNGEDDYLPVIPPFSDNSLFENPLINGPIRFFQPDGIVDSKRDRNLILESFLVSLEKNSFGEMYPEISQNVAPHSQR